MTRTYLGALRPALSGSLALIVAVSFSKWVNPPTWPLYLRFGIEVIAGGAAFMIVLITFHGDRIRSFLSLYQRIRASNSAIATG
jgi:hypothetical protein